MLAITGWSLLAVSLSCHVYVATTNFSDTKRSTSYYGDMPAENFDEQPVVTHQYDAVIVGAGWAGLKAAKTLLDSGVSNILVLEANDYIGGRSKSVNQDGSINVPSTSIDNIPAELGSEWLYDHNFMAKYLKKEANFNEMASAFVIDPNAYSGLLKSAQFYKQTRLGDGTLHTKELKDKTTYKDKVWERIRIFRRDRLKKLKKGDESWGETFDSYKTKKDLTGKEIAFIDLLEDVAKIEYTCESDKMSLRHNDLLDQSVPTTRYMGIPGLGFGNVASRFGQQFSSKINLNSKVIEINHYDGGQHAFVKYTSNGRIVEVAAKTVLVTASLGVLKAGTIKFSPRLPRYKREIIDGMGFGVVNKCSMYWNDASNMVWPADVFWFKLISAEETRWTYFFNPSSYKGTPTLTAWIGGEDAVKMERRTDEEVMNKFVMKNLKSMFPSIRYPDRVIVTRWSQEENIRGTYSYAAAHRDFTRDAKGLKRRVGRLWFAGEATASPWHGTTVGAWATGKDAAQDMAETLMPPIGVSPHRRGESEVYQ